MRLMHGRHALKKGIVHQPDVLYIIGSQSDYLTAHIGRERRRALDIGGSRQDFSLKAQPV